MSQEKHLGTKNSQPSPLVEEPALSGEQELSEDELEEVSGGTKSTGPGTGKVTFNPFSISKKFDKASANLF